MSRTVSTGRAIAGANILCGLVSGLGMLVMLGWFLDIPALKSVSPDWVTMKFATAFSFVLSGAMIYCVGRIARGDRAWAQVLLPGLVLMILLLMVSLLTAAALHVDVGMAELFVRESAGAVQTVQPGRPSTVTMICFTLIAAVGLVAMFVPAGKPRLWKITGAALCLSGAAALLGYALGEPALYYYWKNLSTAMAMHTALLFMLVGAALWLMAFAVGRETAS